MYFMDLGSRVRTARLGRGLTQAQLAQASGISRVTLNQLEGGTLRDLGFAKVAMVLSQLGLELHIDERRARQPDRLAMAATTASVGFRHDLSTQELLDALLKGRAPQGKRPHLRRLFEDSPPGFVRRLLEDVSRRTTPGRVSRGMERLARELDLPAEQVKEWMRPG